MCRCGIYSYKERERESAPASANERRTPQQYVYIERYVFHYTQLIHTARYGRCVMVVACTINPGRAWWFWAHLRPKLLTPAIRIFPPGTLSLAVCVCVYMLVVFVVVVVFAILLVTCEGSLLVFISPRDGAGLHRMSLWCAVYTSRHRQPTA